MQALSTLSLFNFTICVKGSSFTIAASRSGQPDGLRSTVRALRSKNRSPKKWLGQHYMLNRSINEKLVEIAEVEDGDLILEIGPGTGSLTHILVEAGAHVIAVEKDPDMAALVLERFGGCGQVEVVQEDFLRWPVQSYISYLMAQKIAENGPFKCGKVVSNLPFNITTNVVMRILPLGNIFSHMVVLLQDEAALRLVDVMPGVHGYRAINLFVNFFSEPEYRFKVDRANFFPVPHVDAAITSFRIKQAEEYPSVASPMSFFSVVNEAFSGKRKMLWRSLQHLYPSVSVHNALKSVGVLEKSRPGELSLDQFVALYNALEAECPSYK
eukprot:c53301_g1_i1 orf=391-1368(-)